MIANVSKLNSNTFDVQGLTTIFKKDGLDASARDHCSICWFYNSLGNGASQLIRHFFEDVGELYVVLYLGRPHRVWCNLLLFMGA